MDKTGHMTIAAHTAGRRNGRQWMRRFLLAAVLLLAAVAVAGICLEERAVVTDFSRKNLPPCLKYLFGTDWMGRDMLSRTLAGLSTSIRIGVLASAVSAVLALFLGTAAAVGGKWADGIISWCIDLMMGVPHIVLLLLISYALGKGEKGVVVGVALTHWPNLARVIRGEILQVREAAYVGIAKQLGKVRGTLPDGTFFRRFFRSSLWDWCYCSRTRSCTRRASRFWVLDCRRRSRRLA